MSTAVFLVRHGETEWHADNRYAGSSDVALTGAGREQARQLAAWAAHAELDAIWSSPLSRALGTAQPAADVIGLRPHTDDRLAELHFGIAEGVTLHELRMSHPVAVDAFIRDPAAAPFPGGEDPAAAARRAADALTAIAERHEDARVLVTAHNALIRLLLCRVLGIPLSNYRRIFPAVRNGALTELRLEGGLVSLLAYNAPAIVRDKEDT